MAAQAYQESTFDPKATSWAGAKGLMQIMPATADHLGLPRDQMYNPEKRVHTSARTCRLDLPRTATFLYNSPQFHKELRGFLLLVVPDADEVAGQEGLVEK